MTVGKLYYMYLTPYIHRTYVKFIQCNTHYAKHQNTRQSHYAENPLSQFFPP